MSYHGEKHPYSGTPVETLEADFVGGEQDESLVEQDEISLGTVEEVDSFYNSLKSSTQEKLQAASVNLDEQNRLIEQLEELQHELNKLKRKMRSGEDLTAYSPETIENLHNHILNEVEDLCELDESEELVPFDPETYAHEQFAKHPYVLPSKRQSVYSLLREHKQALKEVLLKEEEGKEDREAQALAEQLSIEIRELVDELVGNDILQKEGVGFGDERVSVRLSPEDLDQEEVGVEVHSNIPEQEESANEQIYTEAELTGSLYGMRIPEVSAPVYAVTSFREGLKIAIGHDKDLLGMPDKQALFADLMEVLDKVYVSDAGLNAVDAEEIKNLVREINTPSVETETLDPQDLTEDVDEPETADAVLSEEQSRVAFTEAGSLPEEMVENRVNFEPFEAHKPLPHAFTPEAIAQTKEEIKSSARQEKEFQADVEKAVKSVEKIGSRNLMNRFFNQSPYESLSGESFDGLIDAAFGPQRNDFLQQLKNDGIDQQAFLNWVEIAADIRETIDTTDKTFKEVVAEDMAREYPVLG